MALDAVVDVLDSKRQPINSRERVDRLQRAVQTYPYFGATGQAGLIDDYIFDEDLILLGEDGVPFLDPAKPKAYRVSGKSWVNNHAHVLRARRDAADWRLVTHALNCYDYSEIVTGSTRLKLTQDAMRRIRLPLPPRAEQQRIADKLDAILARVDACRDRLDRVGPLLQQFRQSVLTAAVNGKLREGADKWHRVRADEVCQKVQSGGTPKSGFASDGVPFLKVYNIVDQQIDFQYRPQYVAKAQHDGELSKSKVVPGDVLMNIVGPPLGKVAVVPDEFPAWNINQAITLFRPSDRVTTDWLYIVLREGALVREVMPDTKGSVGQVNISLSQCRAFELPIPPVVEQQAIAAEVRRLMDLADRLEERLRSTVQAVAKTTPALLAKAFRGELVPQDPNDEPAAAMLAQLTAQASPQPASKRGRRTA